MMTPRRPDAIVVGWIILCSASWLPGRLSAQPGPGPNSPAAARLDRHGDPLPPGTSLRLGTVKYRQDSPISRIAFAPDGKHFVTDGQDSVLRVWDAARGRVIRRIDPGVGVLEVFDVTSDGKLVMAVGTTFEVGKGFFQDVAWIDLEAGRVVDQGSWPAEAPGRQELAICPDRRLVAIGLDGRSVRVLEAAKGAEVCRFELGGRPVGRLRFSRDGRWLAVDVTADAAGRHEVELEIDDLDRKRGLRIIRQAGVRLADFVFSPDGSRVAVAIDGSVGVWDVASGERISFEDGWVDRLCYSADGQTLMGYARSGRIRLFGPGVREGIGAFRTDSGKDGAVVLSPDGRTLLVAGGEGLLHCWDLEGRRDRSAVGGGHVGRIRIILVPPDQKTLITAGDDPMIRLWDLADGRLLRTLEVPGGVYAGALSPDGRWLVVADADGHRVFGWDLAVRGGPIVITHDRGRERHTPLAMRFRDDHRVLLVDDSGRVHGIDVKSRAVTPGVEPRLSRSNPGAARIREMGFPGIRDLVPPAVGDHRIVRAAFLPDGNTMAVISFTGLHVLETGTGQEIQHAEGGDPILASPDGRLLAVAISMGKLERKREDRMFERRMAAHRVEEPASLVRLLDPSTGQESGRIVVDAGRIWAMAFSPNGRTLAVTTGWEAGRIHLYEVRHGEEIRRIDGPPLRSVALTFTPDGSRLVSGMADGTVLVWDVRTGPGGP